MCHLSHCFSPNATITLTVLKGIQVESIASVLTEQSTHMKRTPGLRLARWIWSQGEGRLMLQAHYPQCSAGPLPARLRRSLRRCSPAPLIPLLGWTLWPTSSRIPNPIQEQKTCFCETFLRCAECILPHKQVRATGRFSGLSRVCGFCVGVCWLRFDWFGKFQPH